MWIFIKPFDVLVFREPKPFTKGESFYAKSIFPPSPTTFQGAIRSKYLSEENIDFEKYVNACKEKIQDEKIKKAFSEIGLPGESFNNFKKYGKLETNNLKGPFLARFDESKTDHNCIFFPLPFNMLGERLVMGPSKILKEVETDHKSFDKFLPLIKKTSDKESEENYWINLEGLKDYLLDRVPLVIEGKKEIYEIDHRVGVELTSNKTSAPGMFYIAEFVQLKENIGFLLKIPDGILPEEGYLRLGGETRGCYYMKANKLEEKLKKLVEGDFKNKLSRKIEESKRFKLYLATPAIFQLNEKKPGWLPYFVNSSEYTGEIKRGKFKLVSAAVGKPVGIGGWDLAKKEPKPMLYAVPSGSVYFFEFLNNPDENTIESLFDKFHFKCISKVDKEIGLGLSFIGTWDYVEETKN